MLTSAPCEEKLYQEWGVTGWLAGGQAGFGIFVCWDWYYGDQQLVSFHIKMLRESPEIKFR